MATRKKDTTEEQLRRAEYIVGIGASAGGLEALQEFFKAMPLDTGLAFVVIQHLSPDYKSLMDELLARHTKLRILKAKDGMLVEPDTIYLIPPRKNLSIFHGKLILEDQGKRMGLILPIDIFFRSLAVDIGKNSIGIILSGTGSDGTLGTRAIKEAGGMVMAQDETTAKFDGMPRSSISTGLVDYILAPGKMADELVNYVKHPFVGQSKNIEDVLSSDEDSLTKVMMILRDYSGIDFSYYKENTIIRRLERRLSINRFERIEDYIRFLSESDKEKDTLYRELLIGVTRFFRDEAAFEIIQNEVLPRLLENNPKQLRLWSVACSTGEEVYSMAMILNSYIEEHKLQTEVKIFATDIDKRSIELAGQGFYPESIVGDIEPELVSRYFVKRENGYQVGERLRKMAIFATHNVLKDPPFSKLDMIVCRNLFIYLKADSQARVLGVFHMALKPGGILFMGSSESLGNLSDSFSIISAKQKIYTRKAGTVSINGPLPLPYSFASRHEAEKLGIFSKRASKRDNITDRVIDAYLPPSLVVDENLNVVHVINDVNPYLSMKSGRFSQNLNNMINSDMALVVNNMLRRLQKDPKMIVFENVKLTPEQNSLVFNIEGRRLAQENESMLFMLSFQPLQEKSKTKEKKEVVNLASQYQNQLTDLQNELQFTKENLQATVEELETSNEELQASNEELIASNEELQSTNEELQSVNEELYTVNSEYQSKIEELTQLNNDITNLLNNTEVAALYLDRKLCIRKFTPSFAKISNLLELDLGRPIHHIATAVVYGDFLNDIEKVKDNLQAIEREVAHKNGSLYLLRIVPYRTDYQAVDGILVTLVNISMLQGERLKLQEASNRLKSALEMGNMAWWDWNVQTGEVAMHEKKAIMLGYTTDEFPTNVYEVTKYIHPEDYEMAMQAMRDHLEGKVPVYNIKYRMKMKNGKYKLYHDKGGIIEYDKLGKPLRVVGIVMDVSE